MKTNVSQFSGASFVGKVVKSGRKVFASATPEITLDTPKDKFTINEKARKLLDVLPGQRIVLIDFGPDYEFNSRFFITKGYMNGKKEVGAKISDNGGFSYSGIYSAILWGPEDPIEEVRADGLVEAERMISRKTKSDNTAYIALFKARCDVTELVDENGDPVGEVPVDLENGDENSPIMGTVYGLTNITFEPHNPQDAQE